jgi:hypothetical protein
MVIGDRVLPLSRPWGTPGTIVKLENYWVTVACPGAGVKLHDVRELVLAANLPERDQKSKPTKLRMSPARRNIPARSRQSESSGT